MQLLQTTENHVPCVFEDEVIVARSAATDVGSGNRDDFNFLALAPGTIVEVLPAAGMSQEEANVKEVDATIVQALHAPTEQVGQLVFAVLGPRPSDSVVSSSKALLRSGESPRAALGEVVVRWINGTFDVRVLQRAKETGATVTFDSEPVLHSRLPRSRLRIVSQARKKEIETAEDQAFAVDSDGVGLLRTWLTVLCSLWDMRQVHFVVAGFNNFCPQRHRVVGVGPMPPSLYC